MAKKIRGKGEGTIHKRPNGTWRTQITQQSRRLSHTAKTRQEVQQWLDKTRRQIEDGMTYASTMITLEEHLASWLLSSRSSKLPSTWKHYNSLIQIYVNPQIGHFKIKDLRPDHIQVLYDYLLQQDVGVWTVIKIHTMLHSALTQAVKLGIISRNPASNTMPPKEPTREMRILDESQVSQLLIATRDTYWEAYLHLAVTTGMRQMEILGLKWTDLDLIKQTLKVERQLDRHRSEGVQFTQPKTRFGRRTVALGTQSIEILRSKTSVNMPNAMMLEIAGKIMA